MDFTVFKVCYDCHYKKLDFIEFFGFRLVLIK
jgi:hypothetical protein